MSIFYKEHKFFSGQNGEMVYGKYWNGSWFVKVPQGEYYSGNYLEKMWFSLFRPYKKEKIKSILILGSGAGCAIYSALKLWPETYIDALDYDPAIMEIGKTHYGKFGNSRVRFIIDKAEDYIKTCGKQYDLIVVDLFCDNYPSPLLKSKEFLSELRKVAEQGGLIIPNLASKLGGDDEDILKSWYSNFPESEPARYKGNKLAVVRVDNTPNDYYNIFQSQNYAESLKKRGLAVIGEPESYLFIQHLFAGLGIVTAMHTDTEPSPSEIRRQSGLKHGLIIWSPWKKVPAALPWIRNPLPPLHQKGNGLSAVRPDYRNGWSQTARRDIKKLSPSSISVESVNKEKFLDGLNRSLLNNSLKKAFVAMIERLSNAPIKFWVVKNENEILSGLAVMQYGNISAHLVAYTTKVGREFQAGTLLIDHWNRYALENKFKYLNFGHIRQDGEPKSWQGYSDFKRKFIDTEIVIRNEYFRVF